MGEKDENKSYDLEEELRKGVLKSLDKELSKEEIKKLTEEAKNSIDFLQKIDEVELPSDKYVIFTDGEEQLYYENGEFFSISSTDSTKRKKKKTKKEATDMYLDYFIKYQLNPILDQRDVKKQKMEIIEKQKAEMAKELLKNEAMQDKAKKQKEKKIEKDEKMI